MRFVCYLLILLFQAQLSFSQARYEEEWARIDEELVTQLKSIRLDDTAAVQKFFRKPMSIDTLGFGWFKSNHTRAGRMTRIGATLYYYQNKLVSYKIVPSLPGIDTERPRLVELYKPLFTSVDTMRLAGFANIYENMYTMSPYWYRREALMKPLKECEKSKGKAKLSDEVLDYMSPESGITYGLVESYGKGSRPNRMRFNEIEGGLDDKQILALFYAINPVSRLMAIEYCVRTNNPLIKRPDVKRWLNRVYDEVPSITNVSGCIVTSVSSREIVERYSGAISKTDR